jgi:hypothetical protein
MTMIRGTRTAALLVTVLLAGAACSSDDSGDGAAPADETTAAADTTSTSTADAGGVDAERVQGIVEALADDEMEGRDNQTDGSVLAQDFLVDQLGQFTEPVDGDSLDGYGHTFAAGTNLIGQIPGGDLADEYVVLGAHYDHLGSDCPSDTPGDDVCNGAGDNAAGVAALLEVGRALADADQPPARSVILALWDAEEDGLLGSAAYVADPAVPLADTIAYINWDIQGVNLQPSLTGTTIMVGAETGGPNLVAAAMAATEASDLQTKPFSLLFGQGRSDHANFAAAGVPIVFFTDANNGCYHSSQDDVDHLDFDKLDQQILTATALAQDLVATEDLPEYDPTAPPAAFADAVSMQEILTTAEGDVGMFAPADQATVNQFREDLDTIVAAGPEAFDDDAVSTLLGGSVDLVDLLASSACDGFVD